VNDFTTTPGDWGKPFDMSALTKAIEHMKATLPPAPTSPFASLFSAKWPLPLYTDPKLPEDRMYLFTSPLAGMSLLTHPKHYALVSSITTDGIGGEELRVGPFTAPSGKQWAVVMDRDTRRRYVVDWPRADVLPRRSA
jgi:hypothetical protein